MTSVLGAPSGVLLGAQRPSVCCVPDCVSSTGEEALELAALANAGLDEWQKFVLANSLGERADGQWAASEVGVVVPRQNGKDRILEVRELVGIFLLGERLITHSAHQFDTSLEAFRRLLVMVESTPDFDRRVRRVSRSHGEEGIEFKGGPRIRFRTRTKGGGRGFTGDCLILNEAMIIPESAYGALLPALSARPNPQVWYTGSAVDQEIHEHGLVLARVRERALAGDDPALAYFEWAADGDIEDLTNVLDDREAWAKSNPGLGIRISTDVVERERRSLAPRTFAVERLGIGDWPKADMPEEGEITPAMWESCKDTGSKPNDPVVLAFDMRPARSAGAIAAAGLRDDDLPHVEIIEHRRGTGWMLDRIVELAETHKPADVICDGGGPAASLIKPLKKRGIEVNATSTKELAQACGVTFDAVDNKRIRHLGTDELDAAVRGAARRPLGEAWAWSRKKSGVDISPLVAVTLALWGLVGGDEPAPTMNVDDYRIGVL